MVDGLGLCSVLGGGVRVVSPRSLHEHKVAGGVAEGDDPAIPSVDGALLGVVDSNVHRVSTYTTNEGSRVSPEIGEIGGTVTTVTTLEGVGDSVTNLGLRICGDTVTRGTGPRTYGDSVTRGLVEGLGVGVHWDKEVAPSKLG